MRLYLNGAEVGSVAKTGSLARGTGVPLHIGRSPEGSNYMRGAIDDVRVFRSGLSKYEVSRVIAAAGSTPTAPTPPANNPPTVSLTSPWPGVTFKVGANVSIKATATDADGTIAQVQFYAGSTLLATDTTSPYGVTWYKVKGGVYTMKAIARDNRGASTSATQIVAVGSSTSPPPPTPNSPPSVSMTAPAAGASFTAPANITLSATASDTGGTIARVEFYRGTTRIGSDTSSPYSLSWSNVAAGSYSLNAIAYDNAGASTSSATRSITVSSSTPSPTPNPPPSVSMTAPASGASFTAPATITLSATASDTGGSVTRVEFYRGTTLIGTDTSSPYSLSWTNVAAGSYSLTAVARDNGGATTVSSTRDITVRPPNLPSTAVFTPSSNHTTVVDRYVLEVFPAGADTRVANPVATRDIGKPAVSGGEIRVDISSTILGLSSGNYVATVTAFGDAGSSQSANSPQFTR